MWQQYIDLNWKSPVATTFYNVFAPQKSRVTPWKYWTLGGANSERTEGYNFGTPLFSVVLDLSQFAVHKSDDKRKLEGQSQIVQTAIIDSSGPVVP